MSALIAGTFPIDLNGINAAGWTQQGTPLDKANLLADSTATSIGLTNTATPNQAIAKIKQLIDQANQNANQKTEIIAGVYTGDDASSRTINLGFKPKAVLVLYEGRIIWNYDVYGGLVFEGYPVKSGEYVALEVASNGFIVHTNKNGCNTNDNDREYHYIAFK